MVALCAGCDAFHAGAAFAVGIMGGFTMWWVSVLVTRLGIDDPLDAFAVHYGGGIVGVLATPVFMNGGIVDWDNCAQQLKQKYDASGLSFPDDDEAVTTQIETWGWECNYAPFQQWAWNANPLR